MAKHIMNSHTLDFVRQIMDQTGGKGVDIVLNSLAGEFIPRSMDVLAPGGRFLEIGKRDIWSLDQVRAARPDVSYYPYDLAELLQQKPAELNAMLGQMLREVETDDLKPIPHTEFAVDSAAAAFRFMAQAKHIGKVVVSLQTGSRLLRPDRTYVVTGGLGALGRMIATWLVKHGAQRLALISRSSPSEDVRHFLADLETDQVSVRAILADVSDTEQLNAAFHHQLSDWPPIGGVVHAAGVLDDAPVLKLNWQRFANVMAPKSAGAWNLHTLTREHPVEFFFLFSSVASIIGSPGQSNYAAGNACLDVLAHHRRGLGLPATSINWGPWEDSGMAARLQGGKRGRWDVLGVQSILPDQALSLLDRLIKTKKVQVVALPMDWSQFFKQTPSELVPSVLREISKSFTAGDTAGKLAAANPPFLDELRRAHPRRRRDLLLAHVLSQARKVLGLTSADSIDPQQGLSSLGMDSLMAVELRSRLQGSLGCSLPATMAFEYPNIDAVVDYLAGEILRLEDIPGAVRETQPVIPPDSAQATQAAREARQGLEDSSEDELARMLEEKLASLGKD